MNERSDRRVSRLSVAASIGLTLMVGATAGHILWPRIASAFGIKAAALSPAPAAYVAGQQIDVPVEWYRGRSRTVVLFARASCAACEKAHPFLKSLVTDLKDHAGFVMAHPSVSEYEDKSYAQSLGIADADVHNVTANLRVKATPTLVLVDQSGAILAAWEGAGSAERQAEIRKTIDDALRRPGL